MLDIGAVVRNSIQYAGHKAYSIAYDYIFDVGRDGLAKAVIGRTIELDDGDQWIKVIARKQSASRIPDVLREGFVVDAVDPIVLKRIVHVKHSMDRSTSGSNKVLECLIDRLVGHGFKPHMVTPPESPSEGRVLSYLYFERSPEDEEVVTIYRMRSDARALAQRNLSHRSNKLPWWKRWFSR